MSKSRFHVSRGACFVHTDRSHLIKACIRASACLILLVFLVCVCGPVCAAEVHTLELQSPAEADGRVYLGISADTFTLADIRADIIIIEFFTRHCALCVKEAPAAAELYHLAAAQSTPQRAIVMLGIGLGNSADEVAGFQQQHSVPFPLVPDPGVRVARALRVTVTPGFIAFRKQSDGSLKQLHARAGILGPPDRFLDSTLKAAAALP